MSAWNTARALLDAKLLTLSGIEPARVQFWNRSFTKPTSGVWYQVTLLPAAVEPELGGTAHEKGIYQVSVFRPAEEGPGATLAAADAVVALFSRALLGTSTKVQCGVPVLAPSIPEPDWFHVPVSIPFQVL